MALHMTDHHFQSVLQPAILEIWPMLEKHLQGIDILLGNFRIRVVARINSTMLQTFDVLTRNPHVYHANDQIGIYPVLSFFNSSFDGLNRFLDIGHDSSGNAQRLAFTHGNNFNFPMIIFRSNQTRNFSCSNIQSDYNLFSS